MCSKLTFLRSAIASLIILFPAASFADVIVYNFIENGKIIGNGQTKTISAKAYFIGDVDSTEGVTLGYLTLGGVKYYTVVQLESSFTLRVNAANGVSYSVLAKAFTITGINDQFEELKTDFHRGRNVTLKISAIRSHFAPRSLSGVSRSATDLGDGSVQITETAISATFNSNRTLTANANNESVSATLYRLQTYLESQGYVPLPQ